MTAWIAAALALPGLVALSLAMERHQEQVFGRTLSARATWAARLAGVALLASSLAICALHWQASVAVAAFLSVLSGAALAVGLGLSYLPRRMPGLALGVLVAGLAAIVLHH